MVKSDQFQDDPCSMGMFLNEKECRKARRGNVGYLGPSLETLSFHAFHLTMKTKFTFPSEISLHFSLLRIAANHQIPVHVTCNPSVIGDPIEVDWFKLETICAIYSI